MESRSRHSLASGGRAAAADTRGVAPPQLVLPPGCCGVPSPFSPPQPDDADALLAEAVEEAPRFLWRAPPRFRRRALLTGRGVSSVIAAAAAAAFASANAAAAAWDLVALPPAATAALLLAPPPQDACPGPCRPSLPDIPVPVTPALTGDDAATAADGSVAPTAVFRTAAAAP